MCYSSHRKPIELYFMLNIELDFGTLSLINKSHNANIFRNPKANVIGKAIKLRISLLNKEQ